MIVLLAFVGFMALMLFSGFLWGSITNKIDKNSYREHKPSRANQKSNTSPIEANAVREINHTQQQKSLDIISNAYNCKASKVKEFYKSFQVKALVNGLGSRSQAERAIAELKSKKSIEASKLGMKPENTPAALMELWSQEVLNEISVIDYLNEANLLAAEKDFDGAFKIITKALSFHELKDRHHLFNAQGEYYLALDMKFDAFENFFKAITQVKEYEPENTDLLNKYIENKNNCHSEKNIKTTIANIESTEDGKHFILKLANGAAKQFPASYIKKVLESHFFSNTLPTILIGTEVTYDTRAYSKGEQIRNEKNNSPVISKYTGKPILRNSNGTEIIKFRFGDIDTNAVDEELFSHMVAQAIAKLESKEQEDIKPDASTESDEARKKAESLAKLGNAFGVKLEKVKEPKMSADNYLAQAAILAANNQHKEAITLISDIIGMLAKGELVGDKLLKPMLINALGESQLSLDKPTDAGMSFEVAIDLIQKIDPNNQELLSKLTANRKKVEDYIVAKEESAKAVAVLYASVGAAFGVKPKASVVEDVSDGLEESTNEVQSDAVAELYPSIGKAFSTKKLAEVPLSESAANTSEITEDGDNAMTRLKASIDAAFGNKPKSTINGQQKDSFEAGDEVSL